MGYAKDIINNGKIYELESKILYQKFSDSHIKIDNIEIYSLNNQIYNNETKIKLMFEDKVEVNDLVPNPILIKNKGNIEIITEKVLQKLILFR